MNSSRSISMDSDVFPTGRRILPPPVKVFLLSEDKVKVSRCPSSPRVFPPPQREKAQTTKDATKSGENGAISRGKSRRGRPENGQEDDENSKEYGPRGARARGLESPARKELRMQMQMQAEASEEEKEEEELHEEDDTVEKEEGALSPSLLEGGNDFQDFAREPLQSVASMLGTELRASFDASDGCIATSANSQRQTPVASTSWTSDRMAADEETAAILRRARRASSSSRSRPLSTSTPTPTAAWQALSGMSGTTFPTFADPQATSKVRRSARRGASSTSASDSGPSLLFGSPATLIQATAGTKTRRRTKATATPTTNPAWEAERSRTSSVTQVMLEAPRPRSSRSPSQRQLANFGPPTLCDDESGRASRDSKQSGGFGIPPPVSPRQGTLPHTKSANNATPKETAALSPTLSDRMDSRTAALAKAEDYEAENTFPSHLDPPDEEAQHQWASSESARRTQQFQSLRRRLRLIGSNSNSNSTPRGRQLICSSATTPSTVTTAAPTPLEQRPTGEGPSRPASDKNTQANRKTKRKKATTKSRPRDSSCTWSDGSFFDRAAPRSPSPSEISAATSIGTAFSKQNEKLRALKEEVAELRQLLSQSQEVKKKATKKTRQGQQKYHQEPQIAYQPRARGTPVQLSSDTESADHAAGNYRLSVSARLYYSPLHGSGAAAHPRHPLLHSRRMPDLHYAKCLGHDEPVGTQSNFAMVPHRSSEMGVRQDLRTERPREGVAVEEGGYRQTAAIATAGTARGGGSSSSSSTMLAMQMPTVDVALPRGGMFQSAAPQQQAYDLTSHASDVWRDGAEEQAGQDSERDNENAVREDFEELPPTPPWSPEPKPSFESPNESRVGRSFSKRFDAFLVDFRGLPKLPELPPENVAPPEGFEPPDFSSDLRSEKASSPPPRSNGGATTGTLNKELASSATTPPTTPAPARTTAPALPTTPRARTTTRRRSATSSSQQMQSRLHEELEQQLEQQPQQQHQQHEQQKQQQQQPQHQQQQQQQSQQQPCPSRQLDTTKPQLREIYRRSYCDTRTATSVGNTVGSWAADDPRVLEQEKEEGVEVAASSKTSGEIGPWPGTSEGSANVSIAGRRAPDHPEAALDKPKKKKARSRSSSDIKATSSVVRKLASEDYYEQVGPAPATPTTSLKAQAKGKSRLGKCLDSSSQLFRVRNRASSSPILVPRQSSSSRNSQDFVGDLGPLVHQADEDVERAPHVIGQESDSATCNSDPRRKALALVQRRRQQDDELYWKAVERERQRLMLTSSSRQGPSLSPRSSPNEKNSWLMPSPGLVSATPSRAQVTSKSLWEDTSGERRRSNSVCRLLEPTAPGPAIIALSPQDELDTRCSSSCPHRKALEQMLQSRRPPPEIRAVQRVEQPPNSMDLQRRGGTMPLRTSGGPPREAPAQTLGKHSGRDRELCEQDENIGSQSRRSSRVCEHNNDSDARVLKEAKTCDSDLSSGRGAGGRDVFGTHEDGGAAELKSKDLGKALQKEMGKRHVPKNYSCHDTDRSHNLNSLNTSSSSNAFFGPSFELWGSTPSAESQMWTSSEEDNGEGHGCQVSNIAAPKHNNRAATGSDASKKPGRQNTLDDPAVSFTDSSEPNLQGGEVSGSSDSEAVYE